MSKFDWYIAIVDGLILIGVWAELWYMLEKRKRATIRRKVTLLLKTLHLGGTKV